MLLEGKVFSDANKPAFGQPGDDFNCRCVKEPLPLAAQIESVSSIKAFAFWYLLHIRLITEATVQLKKDVHCLRPQPYT